MKTLLKPLTIVVFLLALLTFLLFLSRSPDVALQERMHDALQTVQLHDAELTRDVLLNRAGALPNYDSLTQTGQKLARALEHLRVESRGVSGDAAKGLAQHVQQLGEALQQKLTLTEYFKSDNALLRNSLSYFVHSGETLGMKAAKPAAAEIAELSHSMLRFMQELEPDAAIETQRLLDRLSNRSGLAQNFAAHGQLIVEVLPQVDGLIRQIIAIPTGVRANQLQDAVLLYAARAEMRGQIARLLLYLVALVFLGYVLYQFVRLRAGAQALQTANAQLRREKGEREQAIAALQASEERFRAINESANDAIVSADSSGRIVSWNTTAEAMFGYHREEILGTCLTRLMPERYHSAHRQQFDGWWGTGRARLAGKTLQFSGLRKDGTEFPLEISLSTWLSEQGPHVTGTIRDLTERKRLEETTRQQELQLIQTNKMTALGTLVSGVAHEVNNPNQLVLTNSKVLSEAWTDTTRILDAAQRDEGEFTLGGLPYSEMRTNIPVLLRDIRDGALRIDRIVSELKDFARPRTAEMHARFDLNDAVRRALRLLAHLTNRRTHHLRVELADGLPSMSGDAQQVEQVVVNLLVNALEALPDREHGVTVVTRFDPAESCLVLEVSDEGVGMPPEHLARLCDPFFTTKQESGGTGLGLAITSSLVCAHGGQLRFNSAVGAGTSAIVTFPVRDEHALDSAAIGTPGDGA